MSENRCYVAVKSKGTEDEELFDHPTAATWPILSIVIAIIKRVTYKVIPTVVHLTEVGLNHSMLPGSQYHSRPDQSELKMIF